MKNPAKRGLLFLLLLHGSLCVAATDTAAEKAVLAGVGQVAREFFSIEAELPVDNELRRATTALLAAHVKRVEETLLPAWLAEERANAPAGLSAFELHARVFARYLNEVALTRVESAGAASDAAWLQAFRHPRACDSDYRRIDFGEPVAMLGRLPPAERAPGFEGLRTLLERWGTPRQDLAPRPAVSVDTEARRLISLLGDVSRRPALALSPMLARSQLSRPKDGVKPEDWVQRCARAQWWLNQQDLSTAPGRARALTAFRYAILDTPQDRFAFLEHLPGGAGDGYPRVASQFGVTGMVTLRLHIDAEGRVQGSEVQKREISVPGIRDNPPVYFETLLDELAQTLARDRRFAKPDPAELKDGVRVMQQEYVFTLNGGKSSGAAP